MEVYTAWIIICNHREEKEGIPKC